MASSRAKFLADRQEIPLKFVSEPGTHAMSTNPNVNADLSSLLEELKKHYELTRKLCWRDYEVESGIVRYIKALYPGVFIHI
jgi:hypothetical protein